MATMRRLWSLMAQDIGWVWVGVFFMVRYLCHTDSMFYLSSSSSQIAAALAELAIPQCMSSALFSLTQSNATQQFSKSVKLLAVRSARAVFRILL